jgi:hypothetical protein
MDTPLNIGDRLELFVDDWLIDEMRGAALTLHQPTPREPALITGQPWEGNMCHYINVLRDGDLCRMYYGTWHGSFEREHDSKVNLSFTPSHIACAESLDGIHWRRPEYGLFEVGGNARNNLVWVGEGEEMKGTHGFAPFIDSNPDCPPEERYKAVGAGMGTNAGNLWAMVSPDGIHWRLLQERPIIGGMPFDSQNLAFFDAVHGEYRAYVRDFTGAGYTGCRGIKTATSEDFMHWTEPVWLEYPGVPEQQLYTNQIMPYPRAPHLFVGFPTRYTERTWCPAVEAMPEPEHRRLRADVSERYGAAVTDGLFMSSRDGHTFRRWSEAFLRPGPQQVGSWAYGDMYQAWGLLETESDLPGAPPELSLYATEGYWRGDDTVFRRYTLRTDGFVSVRAPFSGGEFVTKPLTFSGSRLTLNMATSGAGSIRVEVQNADGKALEGYTLSDCDEVVGDELARTVSWKGSPDLGGLGSTPVRLRFALSDADLYAMQFVK